MVTLAVCCGWWWKRGKVELGRGYCLLLGDTVLLRHTDLCCGIVV